jgi:hypothetical protein
MKRIGQFLAGMGLIGMMAFTGAGVTAQEGGTTQLLVQSIYCADSTGYASGDCTPAAGVSVSVQLLDGGALGSCVTEAGVVREASVGYCYVEVPYGVEVLATQDDSTLAQGYVSTNNPQQVTVRAQSDEAADYIPVAQFINVPVAEEPVPAPVEETVEAPIAAPAEEPAPAPVTSLPSTGSGYVGDGTDVALIVATATVAAAALGAATRRYQEEVR